MTSLGEYDKWNHMNYESSDDDCDAQKQKNSKSNSVHDIRLESFFKSQQVAGTTSSGLQPIVTPVPWAYPCLQEKSESNFPNANRILMIKHANDVKFDQKVFHIGWSLAISPFGSFDRENIKCWPEKTFDDGSVQLTWFQTSKQVIFRLRTEPFASSQPSWQWNRRLSTACVSKIISDHSVYLEIKPPNQNGISETLELFDSFDKDKSFIYSVYEPNPLASSATVILEKKRDIFWPRLTKSLAGLSFVSYWGRFWTPQHSFNLSTCESARNLLNIGASYAKWLLMNFVMPLDILNQHLHPLLLSGIEKDPTFRVIVSDISTGSMFNTISNLDSFLQNKTKLPVINAIGQLYWAFMDFVRAELHKPYRCGGPENFENMIKLGIYAEIRFLYDSKNVPHWNKPTGQMMIHVEKNRLKEKLTVLASAVVEEHKREAPKIRKRAKVRCTMDCLPVGVAKAFRDRNEEMLYLELAKLSDEEAEWCMEEAGKAELWDGKK